MHIWVDADACPGPIKEILFRAAERTQTSTTLVANHQVKVPPSRHIKMIQVSQGFDIADNRIAGAMQAGDLVITADIPLAAEVVAKGGVALNPRGTLYTVENVKQHLATRDLMEQLRSAGLASGGPPPLDKTDRQSFANQLDRLLAAGS